MSISRLDYLQEGVLQNYRSKGTDYHQASKSIWVGEGLHNAAAHNAKNAIISSIMTPDGKYNILMAHDGDPILTYEQMMDALRPNTSCDETGRQGCGGLLSPLLLVHHLRNYRHIMIAKTPNGIISCQATLENGTFFHEETNPKILDCVKIALNKPYSNWKMVYLSTYDPIVTGSKKETFCTEKFLSVVSDLNPFWLSGKSPLRTKIILNSLLGDELKSNSRNLTMNTPVAESFDSDLMDNCFDFRLKDVHVKFSSEKSLTFDAVLKVKLYSGVYREKTKNNGGSSREGYVNINGKSLESIRGRRFALLFDTLVFSDWAGYRFKQDPHYFGNQSEKISAILSFQQNKSKYKDVEKIFPKLKIPANQTLVRRPFVKQEIHITKIKRVDDKLYHKDMEADVRGYLGGIDLFFRTDKPAPIVKVIESICNAVDRNSLELVKLRERAKILFPVDLNSYGPLPVETNPSSERRLYFLSKVDDRTNKSISRVKPDITYTGLLQHAETGEPVDIHWKLDSLFEGVSLVHASRQNWNLNVGPLRHRTERDEQGELRILTEDEYKNLSSRDTLPNRDLRFTRLGLEYTLSTKVDLPKQKYTLTVKGRIKGVGKEEGKSLGMYQELYPVEKRVAFHSNNLILNTLNSDNEVFKNIPTKEIFRKKFWSELQEAARYFNGKVLQVINIKGFQSSAEAKEICEIWGYDEEDLKQYLLNLWIEREYQKPEVRRMREYIKQLKIDNPDFESTFFA